MTPNLKGMALLPFPVLFDNHSILFSWGMEQ